MDEQYSCGDRSHSSDSFDRTREPVRTMPECPHFHAVRGATGHDERSKAQEHPIERQIWPLAYEIDQGNGNGEVGESDKAIRSHMEPDQARFPYITEAVGHETPGRKK